MSHATYRFGEFIIDPAARELWTGAQLVALPPKSFECLAYLLEHRDRAVGRDELISAVWGRVDVSDTLLAQTLLRARRAVHDTGSEQTTIRTVPRFGYRWVAAVTLNDGSAPADRAASPEAVADRVTEVPAALVPTPIDAPPTDLAPVAVDTAVVPTSAPVVVIAVAPARRHQRRWVIGCAAVVLLGLVAFGIWRTRTPAPRAAAMEELVLVLPVAVTTDDRESSWIRLGAMDYIASRLRDDGHLKVLPSEQTMALLDQGDRADPRGAGDLHRLEQATGAAYILTPRATHGQNGWDFALDIYHAGGTRTIEASAGDPLAAAGIAAARFEAGLGLASRSAPSEPSGLAELLQRIDAALLVDNTVEARSLIEQAPAALKDDPAIRVRAGQIAFRAGQLDEAQQVFSPLASQAGELAAAVRAQAQMGLGAVAIRHQDFAAAEQHYTDAIATLGEQGDPGLLGHAYIGLAVSNTARNRFDPALAEFGRARVELERAGDHLGMARVDTNLGLLEGHRARYTEAVADFDRAIAVYTRFSVRDDLVATLLGKANAQLALVDIDGALASSERAWELAGHLENLELVQHVAGVRWRALLASGQLTAASDVLGELAKRPGGADIPDADLLRARVALARGDATQALTLSQATLAGLGEKSMDAKLSDIVATVVEAAIRSGQLAVGRQALDRLRASPESAADPQRAFTLELDEAEILDAGNTADAGQHYAAALAIADQRGVPEVVVTAGSAYAHYLIAHHDLDQATAIVGRLSPYADRDYRVARVTAALYAALGDKGLQAAAEAKVAALSGERTPDSRW